MKNFLGILLFATLIFSIQSCSDSSNSGSSGDGVNPLGGPGSQKTYTESYEFKVDNCPTGKHVFSSNSASETKDQLCKALQNETLNRRCAQQLRYEMFSKKCSGVSWRPGDGASPDLECIKYVGGSYPSTDERTRAAYACAGVRDLEAVRYVAGSYPTFIEREQAAKVCAGNLNMECTKYVAGSYPTTQERMSAAGVCHNVDVVCVKQVAGSYPTFTERVNAARSCGGN